MSSESLSFVPRKVGKPKPSTSLAGSAHTPAISQPSNDHDIIDKPEASSKRQCSEEDTFSLVSLALSDYALWLNSEIRRKIDDSVNSGDEGFVGLNYILHHSPILTGLASSTGSETAIVKAIRSQASPENPAVEVRMVLKKPEWHNWGRAKDQKDTGMYEIRKKDWQSIPSTLTRYTREYWEQRTVYMENIPAQYKSPSGIASFVHNLIASSSIDRTTEPSSTSTSHSLLQLHSCFSTIQAITLPPHQLDKRGDEPKFKGFAFVILSSVENVKHLLEIWSWEQNLSVAAGSYIETDEVREARRIGFRCLSKARWDALKDEYLAYRENLVQELVAFEDQNREDWHGPDDRDSQLPSGEECPNSSLFPHISPSSSFPPSCLVFIRNIHPETNKTTLKALFSKTSNSTSDVGIDYVDFNKGMNSCYLRLTTPGHARNIVEYFAKHSMVQTSGLDSSGTASSAAPPITVELVLDRKEEIYWEKVPLKVRSAAVQKCLEAMEAAKLDSGARGNGGTTADGEDGGVGKDETDGRCRKRRKKKF